ncbi:MAG: radical SAM protein [Lachnospiraceae bacterium]|nr:radical SAM protein [Lachnospiraceae bacterium]
MKIDRILAPIETLGPGQRLVIWTRGCSKHCRGCANPELWDIAGAREYAVGDILQIIGNISSTMELNGITISGGDPLEQREELLQLTESLAARFEDILVYTGYEYRELEMLWTGRDLERLRASVAVLIDGPYREEENRTDVVLRGSANQQIIFFKEHLKTLYEAYLQKGRKIQNIYMGRQLVSVGIHSRKETQP